MTAPRIRSGWVALAGELLGRDLYDWITARRTRDKPYSPIPSYRSLAAELRDITNGKVSVSHQALFQFYKDETARSESVERAS